MVEWNSFILSIWKPVYNGAIVAKRPSVCAFVALFPYTLKWLFSSLFYIKLMYFNIWHVVLYTQINLMEKYNKISSKIYKHLMQQKRVTKSAR